MKRKPTRGRPSPRKGTVVQKQVKFGDQDVEWKFVRREMRRTGLPFSEVIRLLIREAALTGVVGD